jgi:hypothetical protein
MYACDRCGARFHSARAASLELCPRCLLRDDAASPLHYAPARSAEERQQDKTAEPGAGSGDQDGSGGGQR